MVRKIYVSSPVYGLYRLFTTMGKILRWHESIGNWKMAAIKNTAIKWLMWKNVSVSSLLRLVFLAINFPRVGHAQDTMENNGPHTQTCIRLGRVSLRHDRQAMTCVSWPSERFPRTWTWLTMLTPDSYRTEILFFIAHNLQLNKQIINSEPLYGNREKQQPTYGLHCWHYARCHCHNRASLPDEIH